MDPATVSRLWGEAAGYLSAATHHPFRGVALAGGLIALAAVASRRIWPLSRTVVTIAHEGGHALAALLAGRRLAGVRVLRSTAGVTVSAGNRTGPGIVLTTAAGYTTPPLLGLGAAALLVTGHLTSMLLLSLAALAGLAIALRNVYGVIAVAAVAAVVALVLWRASPLGEAAFGYTMAWFLLLGGARPVLELRGERRRHPSPRTDADQLARLTGVAGGVWVAFFGLVSLAALAVGGYWLLA